MAWEASCGAYYIPQTAIGLVKNNFQCSIFNSQRSIEHWTLNIEH